MAKMMYIVGRDEGIKIDMTSFETRKEAEEYATLVRLDGGYPYIRYGESPFCKDYIEG